VVVGFCSSVIGSTSFFLVIDFGSLTIVGLNGSMKGDGIAFASTTPSEWIGFSTSVVSCSCRDRVVLHVFLVVLLGYLNFSGSILINYAKWL